MKSFLKFLSISLVLPSVPFACQSKLKYNSNCTKKIEGKELTINGSLLDCELDNVELRNKTEPHIKETEMKVIKEKEGHETKSINQFVTSPMDFDNNSDKSSVAPTSSLVTTPNTKLEVTSIHSDIPTCKVQTKCVTDAGAVAVPKYAFYIIGFVIIILLAAVIFLGVLLYQNKLNEYQVFAPQATPTGPINVDVARKYMTQSSQEMTLLNITPDNKNDTMPKTEETIDISTNKMPQSPMKIYKSVRRPVDHQMLLREQMKKICEDALAKSQNTGIAASLKDLNTLLNEFDDAKPEERIVREKSASFPQLDIYDEPPARKKPVAEEHVDIPVYDCLPSSNNIIIRDYDSNYLLALSKENCSDIEPDYINAKYRSN